MGSISRPVALMAMVACAEPIASSTTALSGSHSPDDGHPEVGLLLFDQSMMGTQDGVCTGTLITPRTVLSAAHCLDKDMTGYGVTETMLQYRMLEKKVHPMYDPERPWEYDIGIAILDRDLTDAPARLAPDPPAIGDSVTLVGVGETSRGAGDEGTKRIGTNDVHSVEALYFETQNESGEANGCNGDSGGPVFVGESGAEAIAGVMSYVPGLGGAGCGPRMWSTRVDLYINWIRAEAMGDIELLDMQPPGVAFVSPGEGASLEQMFAVEIAVSDGSGVASVTLEVDGSEVHSWSEAPFDHSLELDPGSYELSAQAVDAAGNQARTSINITVREPGEPPPPDTGPPPSEDASTPVDAGGADGSSGPVDPGEAGDEGCGCSTQAAPSTSLLWLVSLVLLRRRSG